MRRRDSIGYEGKSVQEVGRFDEKTDEKVNALSQRLRQEWTDECEREKNITQGHNQGHQRQSSEIEDECGERNPVERINHKRQNSELGCQGKDKYFADFEGKSGKAFDDSGEEENDCQCG